VYLRSREGNKTGGSGGRGRVIIELEGVLDALAARSTLTKATAGVAHQTWIKKLPSHLRRQGRQRTNQVEKASLSPLQRTEASRGGRTACLVEQTCGRVYEPLTQLVQPLQKAIIPREKRRRNKNRDVQLNRHPRGRTCSNGTFRPSRPRNKNPAGVRLHAWGENPPSCLRKRERRGKKGG